ncbi:MAG: MFS transporter [Pseudomonadota bacterium]
MAGAAVQLEQNPAGSLSRRLIPAIAALSLMQAMIGQFIVQGVPLFLRDAGHSATIIGMVYLVSLPYVLRFLWAPLVDRYGVTRFGHFRSWILGGHVLACCALGLFILTDPATRPVLLLLVILPLMVGIACQLTATGGLMADRLSPQNRASGVAAQSAGSGVAGLVLGLCVLYLLADSGWSVTVSALLAFALAGLCGLCLLTLDAGSSPPPDPAPFWSQLSIVKRRDTRKLLMISVLVAMGLVLTYGLKSLVLIDAGYSVSEAGLVGLLFGNAAGVVCALAARPLVDRWGGLTCLAAAGAAVMIYCLVFAVLFMDGPSKVEAAAFAIIANGLLFAAFIASRSLVMGRCAEGAKASEFATFVSLEGLVALAFAGIGNVMFAQVGFPPVLLLAAAGSLCGAWWAWSSRAEFETEEAS